MANAIPWLISIGCFLLAIYYKRKEKERPSDSDICNHDDFGPWGEPYGTEFTQKAFQRRQCNVCGLITERVIGYAKVGEDGLLVSTANFADTVQLPLPHKEDPEDED